MEQREQMVAFWLVPARAERDFFASLIDLLALRFNAPRFEPHVTLFGGDDINPAGAEQVLVNATQGSRIELQVERIAFSSEYTKTLFVQFRRSKEAEALSQAFCEASGSSRDYKLDPHLSLAYADLPVHEKKEIAHSLELPFESVTFDAVKVITGHASTSGPDDVASWRVLAERRLPR
ncbi:hypothetical protein BH20VER1_BH20VER1_12380 [soil metagenome]